jgi:RNA polymerase sigma factor (sigma-70 family)
LRPLSKSPRGYERSPSTDFQTPIQSPLLLRQTLSTPPMATLPSPPDDLTPEQLYLGHLEFIEKVVSHSCRRSRFGRQDTEDFGQHVHLKLIEDDYARVRRFEGRSNFQTYLTTVIQHLLLDYQNHVWKKWRSSAEGERLGPVAMRLDRLLHREGYSFNEACEILRTNEKVGLSVAELADLRGKLPHRSPLHLVGEELMEAVPSEDPRPDERIEEKERGGRRRRLSMAFYKALETLSKEERFFASLLMKYKIADIARIHGWDQKSLYRRKDKLFKKLRKELERQGVNRRDLDDIFDD